MDKKMYSLSLLSTLLSAGMIVTHVMAADKAVFFPILSSSKSGSAVAKTGQTLKVPFTAPAGSDGDLQKGVAWPNPRFTENVGEGTVTDNLTGLVWLKNANCFEPQNWNNALDSCKSLATGTCGLKDGSSAEQWRLPNEKELHSLIDLAYNGPALSNDAGTGKWVDDDTSSFSGVQLRPYWSSSSYAYNTDKAWFANLNLGSVGSSGKQTDTFYVWPVRD